MESTKTQRIQYLMDVLKGKEKSKKDLMNLLEEQFGEEITSRTLDRYLNEIASIDDNFKTLDFRRAGYKVYTIAVPKEKWLDKSVIDSFKELIQELQQGGNLKYESTLGQVSDFLEKKMTPRSLQKSDKHWVISHGPLAFNYNNVQSNKYQATILKAIDNRNALKIGVYKGGRTQKNNLVFYPLKMVLRVGQLYVLGVQKNDSEILKTIRFDRIGGILQISAEKVPEKYFELSWQDKVNSYFKYKFSNFTENTPDVKPRKVVLKCLQSWFFKYMEDSNFDPQVILNKSENTVQIEIFITDDFLSWLAGNRHIGAIEVLAPSDIAERIN